MLGFFSTTKWTILAANLEPPISYGLIGGEANAIAPNKRMLSSMTPTIVTYNDKLKMVLGTPGGSTIITSVYQTLLNVIDHGMGMQEAVNAKRVHHQWYPDEIQVETGALSKSTQAQLETLGHQLRMTDKIGRMDCILVLPDGRLEGGADPRGDNTAIWVLIVDKVVNEQPCVQVLYLFLRCILYKSKTMNDRHNDIIRIRPQIKKYQTFENMSMKSAFKTLLYDQF